MYKPLKNINQTDYKKKKKKFKTNYTKLHKVRNVCYLIKERILEDKRTYEHMPWLKRIGGFYFTPAKCQNLNKSVTHLDTFQVFY